MKKIIAAILVLLNLGCSGSGLFSEPILENKVRNEIIPKLFISAASQSAVNQSSDVIYQINYSEVNGITLTDADIMLTTTGTATCTKTVTMTNFNTAQLTLNQCMGDGNLSFQIRAGSAVSSTGHLANASVMSATFTVDNTGPSSVSYTAPSGRYSAVPASVPIVFPEVMDGSTISAANFTLGGSCTGVSIASVTTSGMVSVINLTGAAGCTLAQTVSLTANLTGVKDALGNLSNGSFLATYTVDSVGPTTATFLPVSGNSISATSTSITIAFPESITASSVTASDFSLSGTCTSANINNAFGFTNEATVQLTGISSCLNGQSVVVTANLFGIQDDIGNNGTGNISAAYAYDNVGPLATFGNASGPVATIPLTISVTFSADTDMASVTNADFTLSGSCSSSVINSILKVGVVANIQITGTGTCTDTQTVTLTASYAGVTDLAGNAGSGSSSVTMTLDTQGPSAVLSLNSSGVNVMPASIVSTFVSDTDMNTVTAADFSITGTCGATLGSISKLGSVVTLNLTGVGSCLNGQTIIVTGNYSATNDLVGNAGAGSSSATLTLDTVGPSGSFNLTSANYNPIPTLALLTLSVDTDMNTMTSADISIGGTCGVTLSGLVKTGIVATINLSGTASCTNGQTVVVTTNYTGLTDLFGNVGSGSISVTLTFDNLGPTFSLVAPTGRYNPLPTTLIATFSADTNMSTVTSDDFIVSGTCGATLSSISLSAQTVTVNLANTASCLTEQTLMVTSNPVGVSDQNGNTGLNVPIIVTHTFDNVAPSAVMLPLGVPILVIPTSIVVTFDADTDMNSVTIADFSASGTCGATISSVTKLANVATVNLAGTELCTFGTTVSVTTTMPGVQDQAVNSGVGSQTQTFTKL